MKIEIEISDIKTAVDAINNAAVAYGDIIFTIMTGCAIPKALEPLTKISEEELTKRFNCLKQIYGQLEEIEKNIKEVQT